MHTEYIILGCCSVFALNMAKYLNEIDLHMDGAFASAGHPFNTSHLVFALACKLWLRAMCLCYVVSELHDMIYVLALNECNALIKLGGKADYIC